MMKFGPGSRGACMAGISALALGCGSAHAQESAARDVSVGGVQDIVVTAQFREQDLQQTPIAITAVNAAMLESRSQTDITEVANQAPNVTLVQGGQTFGGSLQASIRGVGQFDFNAALEPGVGIYVDDVYYSSLTGSVLDLLDLDRVEILRGPQGTLAGRNSIGGAVRLYSRKATGAGGFVEAAYGSLNRIELRASADLSIVQDRLFMRISGVSKSQDGYVTRLDYACANPGSGLQTQTSRDDCVLGHEGGEHYGAVRANVRWVANDDVEVNIIGDFTSNNSQGGANTLTFADDPRVAVNGVPYDSRFIPSDKYVSYAGFCMPADVIVPGTAAYCVPDRLDYRGWGMSGTVDWSLGDNLSIKSISAYRGFTNDFAQDLDTSPLPVILAQDHVTNRQYSQELRLNGSIGDNVEFTVGGFLFKQKSVYTTHQAITPFGLEFIGVDTVKANSEAAFAHVQWDVTDALQLVGGLRYTHDRKTLGSLRFNRDGTPHPFLGSLNSQAPGVYSGDRWDYRAGINYAVSNDVMAYAQISTGFKGGGVNPRPLAPLQVQPFGSETLTAYEVGLKSKLFDHMMRLNLAGFYNEYKDIQLILLRCDQFSPAPGFPCALPANAGDAKVWGVEAEAELHPVEGLQIDGSASYLHFKYTRIDPGVQIDADSDGVVDGGVLPGMISPFSPKWKWSFGIQYEIPAGSMGSITPRLDGSYEDSFYVDPVNAPTNRVTAKTLFNARITWKSSDDDWQAALSVTNLFDKFYYMNIRDNTGFGLGLVSSTPSPGRLWAVTVKRKF